MLLYISQQNPCIMISEIFGSSVPQLNLKIGLFRKMIAHYRKSRTFADPFFFSSENFYPWENLQKHFDPEIKIS